MPQSVWLLGRHPLGAYPRHKKGRVCLDCKLPGYRPAKGCRERVTGDDHPAPVRFSTNLSVLTPRERASSEDPSIPLIDSLLCAALSFSTA